MKVKILSVFLSFLVIALPVKSFAIIPLLIPLATSAAEIAIGQFAAAGVARVINPTTTKTLEIPNGNRALKVSFGAASAVAAIALFATKSGYDSSSPAHYTMFPYSVCHSSPVAACNAYINSSSFSSSGPGGYSCAAVSKYSASIIKPTGGVFSFVRADRNCFPVTSVTEVAWQNYSLNSSPTQASTDKLVADLKVFSVSNPADFAKIASISAVPAAQSSTSYALAGGIISVSVSASGVVSGASGHSLTLTASNNLLVDGVAGTGSVAGAGAGAGTGAGAGAVDMSGVIAAVNASSSQAVIDAKTISDKLDILNKKCTLNPNLVECKDLGAFNVTAHNFGNGITSADTFSSIYTKHNASWTASPIGSTISRLFPSTGISGFPVWSINLSGTTLTLDMANYSTFFSMLGSLVIVLAGFQSIKIILGRD